MLKKTSKDGVVIQPFSISDPHRALLADFDIDGSQLKPAHREWLDGVATFLRKHPIPHGTGKWVVTITGRASKTGSDSHNGWLSKQRAEAVRNYLLPKLPRVSIEVALAALGESSPFNAAIDENAKDRSVEIVAVPVGKPTPPPPVKPTDPTPKPKIFELTIKKFKLTMVQLRLPPEPHIAAGGWGWCKMALSIEDPGTEFKSDYFFEGSGFIARGGHDTKSVARGQAQEFTAASELKENDFDGSARLRLENGGSKDFRFGAFRSLHDFKVSKESFKKPFRLPPMSVPLLGHAWITGELTLDFPKEDWFDSDGPIAV